MSLKEPNSDRLEAYRFHEEEWDDYDELYESFEWQIPEKFNIARYTCDRWVESGNTALITETDDGTHEYTFEDLQKRANEFANYLRAQGIERGDCVAVNGTQRVEVLTTHLACWKLGAISMPMSVRFDPDELHYRLEDSGASVCVLTEGGIEAFRTVKNDLPELDSGVVVDIEPEGEEIAFSTVLDQHDDDHETVEIDPEEPASIVYTSGTTGDPKGVVLPHQHLLGVLPTVLCGVFNMEIREDDVLRTPVGWSWVGSFNTVVLPALYYGKPVLAADTGSFHPRDELELWERHEVTLAGGPPTAFRVMFNFPTIENTDLSSLRVVGFGGEAAGDTVLERASEVAPDAAIHKVYGQGEAAGFISHCEALGVDYRTSDMGRAGPGHEVRALDPESLDPLEPGELGELAVSYEENPMCFTEYRNAPEKTAEKIRDGWMLCEDLGIVDENENLVFHSRKDDAIVSSGHDVAPGKVEDELARHDAVFDAGVIGIPDGAEDERVKAFVSLSLVYDPSEGLRAKLQRLVKQTQAYVVFGEEYVPAAELKSKFWHFGKHVKASALPWDDYDPTEKLGAELQQFVKQNLETHERPSKIEFVEELPKTNTRKVRRRDLRVREGVTQS